MLGLVRITLIVLVGLVAVLLDTLGNLLYIPNLVYGWSRLVHLVLTRLLLILMGFHWIPCQPVNLQRQRQVKKKTHVGQDLIIANHCSYVDILYLAFRFAPLFLFVNLKGQVVPLNTWQAIWYAGSLLETPGTSLESFVKSYRGARPLLLFPEGTTSNGRGLLTFFPFDFTLLKVNLRLIGLKYEYQDYCPCYTTDGKFVHFWWLICQFANYLTVKPLHHPVDLNEKDLQTWMGQVTRLRKVGKTALDKQDFLAFYTLKTKK